MTIVKASKSFNITILDEINDFSFVILACFLCSFFWLNILMIVSRKMPLIPKKMIFGMDTIQTYVHMKKSVTKKQIKMYINSYFICEIKISCKEKD